MTSPSGFSMGGAPSQTNELLVDGAPDTTWDLRVSYNPPVDAVQEVRVHAFEADAAPAPGPLTGPISYLVVAGDSLSRLSVKFDVSIARIKQLNKLKSDTIYIGQTLTIAP